MIRLSIYLYRYQQAFIKYIFICDFGQLVKVTVHISEVYKVNSLREIRNYELCQTHARHSQMVIKIVPAMNSCIAIIYLIPSYIQYFLTGNYAPSLGIYLPALDTDQLPHIIAMESLNITTAIMAVLTVSAVDSLIYIVLINLTMMSRIISSELNEFETVLRDGVAEEREIRRRLTKIILMHKQYNE